jgi:hypothetical protein
MKLKLVTFFFIFLFINNLLNAQQLAKKIGEIPPPGGYKRVEQKKDSFGEFLRNQELKQENSIVFLYNGKPKANQDAQYSVLSIDVGDRDLQQCADAVMRLWAEYLYSMKEFDKIVFHFTDGRKIRYRQYAEGYRTKRKGKQVEWGRFAKKDYSYKAFRRYMDLVFTYAGTSSMKRYDTEQLNEEEIIDIGHILLQEGNPYGHAVLIVDKAVNKEGKTVYLLAQSFMPAQEIHILRNFNNLSLSPWYEIKDKNIRTPEWDFLKKDLVKFKNY